MAKVSVLQDLFTGSAIDTTKWTVTGTVTVSNGLASFSSPSGIQSIANFDYTNSNLVFGPVVGDFQSYTGSLLLNNQNGTVFFQNPSNGTQYGSVTYNAATMKYFRFTANATDISAQYSANNYTWTNIGTAAGQATTSYPIRFSAPQFSSTGLTLDAVNPPANLPPTVDTVSPADASIVTALKPALVFKGTDTDSEKITYQLQIARDESFTTLFADDLSAGGTGFSGTDPYTSGSNVTYTIKNNVTQGGITYYWRVRGKDTTGTNTFGQWTTRSFITQPFAPQVTSISSSNVSINTATASGNVTGDGGGAITERGIVYGTGATPTTSDGKKTALGTTGAFSASLTGLKSSTVYNWRAYAINSTATSYGGIQSFTTLPDATSITGISNIGWDTARVAVSVPSGGGSAITERGVVYSTVANPTVTDNKIVDNGSGLTYTATLTNLTGNSQYYVRAYATNAQGTSYSPQSNFTTAQQPAVPTVSTGTAASITENAASINGSNATLDGTQPVTERGIVYSYTNNDPQYTDSKVAASSSGLGSFNVSLSGLKPETTYYARAYAKNSIGVGYGSVTTFKTLALFIPDAGDGYWTWKPTGSDALVARTQPTPANSSANLLLSELNLEDGAKYTLYYSGVDTDQGSPRMVLQWFDNLVKKQQVITAGTPYTFTYDKTKLSWAIRLYVTGSSAEPDNINATFKDMYLAKEDSFTGFVPFIERGLTEIKLENNWLLDKNREDVINSIFSQIYGIGWRPFTATTIGLGWLEVGDQFTIVDNEGPKKVILWNTSMTVDGSLSETLKTDPPEKTETDYNKAGSTTKSVKRTQISVDHNLQQINSLVEDVYSDNGVVNTKFSQIEQDIDAVTTTVQSSGGVNLIRNSVMYSFDDDGNPDYWTQSGTGTLTIQASPESRAGGGISGNIFTLNNKTVTQTVTVRKDADFVAEADKLYYSFSARVKKNIVGNAVITFTNRNESYSIPLPDQTEYFWEAISLEGLLPQDDHYDISIYSDSDANLQVTDVMLSPGKNIRQWTQANGEAMNTNVQVTDSGMTIRSNVYRNDYVKIDALGLQVNKHEAGGDRVFGFNGDETNVRKLRAEQQISLAPIRMVPINYSTYKGTAFTRTEDN